MKKVKVRLKKEEKIDMGFIHGRTYNLTPFTAENGMKFYERNGSLFLQWRFYKVKK